MELENNLDDSIFEYKIKVKGVDDQVALKPADLSSTPKNNQDHENPVDEYPESFNSVSEETDKEEKKEKKIPFLEVSPEKFIPDKELEHDLSKTIENSESSKNKKEVSLPISKKKRIKNHVFRIKTEQLLETLKFRRKEIEFIITNTPNLNDVLGKVLEKCKFSFKLQELKDFPEEFNLNDDEYVLNYQENRPLDLNFDRIYNSCQTWHTVCLFPNPLRTKLKLTLWEFINLRKIAETEQDLQFLQEMIKKLLFQLKKMLGTQNPLTNPKEATVKPNDALTEVFNFYIKQQKVAAKTSTFDTLDNQFKTLTLPKFLFFCKDFKLLKQGKNPKKVAEQIQALQEIFTKNADFSKQMTKTHFLACLSDLSALFLTEEYDSQHSTQYFSLPPEEKLKKFLEIVGLTGKQDLKSKLIGCDSVKLMKPKLSDTEIIRKKPEKTKKNMTEIKKAGKKLLNLSANTEDLQDPTRNTKTIVTMESLMKSKKNLIDLSELIQEGSSDEEMFKKLGKNKKTNLSHSVSNKIIARGQELSMIQQKSDNRKAYAFLNSKFITRVFKYSKK